MQKIVYNFIPRYFISFIVIKTKSNILWIYLSLIIIKRDPKT